MTALASVPINNLPGTTVLGPWTVPDSDNQLTLSYSNWTQVARTVAHVVDISMDGGGTWLRLGTMDPTPGGVASPRGPVADGYAPLPMLCQCGVYYLPGDRRYDRALSHSTVALKAGVTLGQVGARARFPVLSNASFLTRILVDNQGRDFDDELLTRTFHTPSPGVNPLRQVRSTLTVAGGRVTTTLTVTSVP